MESYTCMNCSDIRASRTVSPICRQGGITNENSSLFHKAAHACVGRCVDATGDSGECEKGIGFDADQTHVSNRCGSGSSTLLSISTQCHLAASSDPASSSMQRLSALTSSLVSSVNGKRWSAYVRTSESLQVRCHPITPTPPLQLSDKSLVTEVSSVSSSGLIARVLRRSSIQTREAQQLRRSDGPHRTRLVYASGTSLSSSSTASDISEISLPRSLSNEPSVQVVSQMIPYNTDAARDVDGVQQEMVGSGGSYLGGARLSFRTAQQQLQAYDRLETHTGTEHGSHWTDDAQTPLMDTYPSGYGDEARPTPCTGDGLVYSDAGDSSARFILHQDIILPNAVIPAPPVMFSSSRQGRELAAFGNRDAQHTLYHQAHVPSSSSAASARQGTTTGNMSSRGEKNCHRPSLACRRIAAAGDASSLYELSRNGRCALPCKAPQSVRVAERSDFTDSIKFSAENSALLGESTRAMSIGVQVQEEIASFHTPHYEQSTSLQPTDPAPAFSWKESAIPQPISTQQKEYSSSVLAGRRSLNSCSVHGSAASIPEQQQHRQTKRTSLFDCIASRCAEFGRGTAAGIRRSYRDLIRAKPQSSDTVPWLQAIASESDSKFCLSAESSVRSSTTVSGGSGYMKNTFETQTDANSCIHDSRCADSGLLAHALPHRLTPSTVACVPIAARRHFHVNALSVDAMNVLVHGRR